MKNWYKTAKLAETLDSSGTEPIYFACAQCDKFKNENGIYLSYEEMDNEEKQQYDKFSKTLEMMNFLKEINNDPIKIETFLDQNPEYIESYQEISSGSATKISHGYCPECFQKEMEKYQKTASINKKPYKLFKKHKSWPESEKKYMGWGWAKDSIDAQKMFLKATPSFSDELSVGYEILVELDRDRIKAIEDAENAKKNKEKRKEESVQDMWWNK